MGASSRRLQLRELNESRNDDAMAERMGGADTGRVRLVSRRRDMFAR